VEVKTGDGGFEQHVSVRRGILAAYPPAQRESLSVPTAAKWTLDLTGLVQIRRSRKTLPLSNFAELFGQASCLGMATCASMTKVAYQHLRWTAGVRLPRLSSIGVTAQPLSGRTTCIVTDADCGGPSAPRARHQPWPWE
jgi:hypothetical protein